MSQGLYERTTGQRHKRRRRNPAGPVIVILLFIALLAIAGTLMLRSCGPEAQEPLPAPEAMQPEAPAPTQEVAPPSTEPATEAPTEEATEAPTEEDTEPVTEATEPPTEETTEETTEPATEPTEEPTEAPTEAPDVSVGQQIADLATAQVGKPYSYGGAGPDSFDTSGFIRYCCNKVAGTSLPHSVTRQADMGTRVEKKDLLPGDVVFFWTSDPDAVEYVGIYVGNGQIVAARNPENPVSQMNMNVPYFTERYLFACRYW